MHRYAQEAHTAAHVPFMSLSVSPQRLNGGHPIQVEHEQEKDSYVLSPNPAPFTTPTTHSRVIRQGWGHTFAWARDDGRQGGCNKCVYVGARV